MKLNNKGPKIQIERELPEADIHQGFCVGIIDLGYQKAFGDNFPPDEHDLQFDGKKVTHRVRLDFEIDQRLTKGNDKGKRMMISAEVNASDHEKAELHKLLLGGYGIDIKKLIKETGEADLEALIVGKPVRVVVKHKTSKKGTTFAYIDSLMLVSSKAKKISMETTEYKIPDFIQTKINEQIPEEVLRKANPQLNWD